MKTSVIIVVISLVAISAVPDGHESETLTYDVVAVKRALLLETGESERQLGVGDSARSGDALRTKSRSSAELAVPARAAVFHIGAKTTFRLAHDRPGVLLEIERGRLRAVFEPSSEGDERERLVTTPSAVLAVRGTEYGIEVEKDGDTWVMVFEGTVEIRDTGGFGDPVRVRAGESTRIRRGRATKAPSPNGLTRGDWDRGRGVSGTQTGSMGSSQQGGAGAQGRGAGGSTGSSSKGSGGSQRHGG